MERYQARNSALEELKNLLMPMILDELSMNQESDIPMEQKKPMEDEIMMKDVADQIADNMEDEDEEEMKKPGISLSITELGMAKPKGKPVMQKKRSAKKRRR